MQGNWRLTGFSHCPCTRASSESSAIALADAILFIYTCCCRFLSATTPRIDYAHVCKANPKRATSPASRRHLHALLL